MGTSGGRDALLLGEAHADASAVNTTSETDLCSFTIPATGVAAGDVLRLSAFGDLLNNSGGNVNFTWKLKIGTTAALATPSTAIGASANRRRWVLDVDIVIESATAQRVAGRLETSAASTDSFPVIGTTVCFAGSGAAAEDTATAKAVAFSVTMGTAVATADMVLKGASLTLIKK